MGRGKLKLEFIANEKARKTTFQKRKKGIMKKAYEFSVLCGIDVCLFISGPNIDGSAGEIETWPPERDAVMRIVRRYQGAAARKPAKKVSSLADVLADRRRKVDGEIARCRRRIAAAKYPDVGELVHRFSAEELAGIVSGIDGKIAAVRAAIAAEEERRECEEIRNVVKSEDSVNGTVLADNIGAVEFFSGAAMVNGCTDTLGLWGPVYEDPTAVNHPYQHYHQMTRFGGSQPMVPYMPYQVNLGPTIGSISQVIRTACEGNSELCSVVNGFMNIKRG